LRLPPFEMGGDLFFRAGDEVGGVFEVIPDRAGVVVAQAVLCFHPRYERTGFVQPLFRGQLAEIVHSQTGFGFDLIKVGLELFLGFVGHALLQARDDFGDAALAGVLGFGGFDLAGVFFAGGEVQRVERGPRAGLGGEGRG
jgi:hypothetical protein